MDSKELVKSDDFPKPARTPRGHGRKSVERKAAGVEAAAIAYVQMENGDYKYPEGARKVRGDHGMNGINTRELMRRAGYGPGSIDHTEYLYDQEKFWELVELHRLRRTDPMFRREQESNLWRELGGEALRNLYERLFYSPHSLSTEQHIKIVKLILDAGITMNKLGAEAPEKTKGLLDTLDPIKRKKVMEGYEKNLRAELEQIESLKKAHKAADDEE